MKHLRIFLGVLFGFLCAESHLQGSWQPYVLVSNPDVGLSLTSNNVLKVNPEGNAIAVWTGFSFFDFFPVICSAYYDRASNTWTPAQVISGFNTNDRGQRDINQGDPDIAMNSSGYAVAVWEGTFNEDAFVDIVFATTRSPSGFWNPIVTPLSNTSDPTLDDDNISVTLNEAGTALAAWRHTNTQTFESNVAFSFLPFGGAWTPIVYSIPNVNDTDDEKPYPFINPSGNAVITWIGRPNQGPFTMEAAIYNAGLNTFTYTTLDIGGDMSGVPTRCSMDANGNAVAVWQNSNQIKTAYFNGTSWETPIILSTSGFGPSIVMDLAGNATATWTEQTQGNNDIVKASSRLPSGAWTTPVSLSSPAVNGVTAPYQSTETLAVNTAGDVIAIWTRGQFFAFDSLFSNYKPFGQDWRAAELVATPSDGLSSQNGAIYNIGLADCGFAVALWQNMDVGFERGLIYAAVNENLLLTPDPAVATCCVKTATGKRCVNVLTWTSDSCVDAYNIYCNGLLIDTVPNTGTTTLQFVDRNVCRKCVYTISTISTFGFEGEQVPFTLKACDCGRVL